MPNAANTFEIHEHRGLRWEFVGRYLDSAKAQREMAGMMKAWRDVAFRVVEMPSKRIIVLHDPRALTAA